jgi:hypothetical protein
MILCQSDLLRRFYHNIIRPTSIFNYLSNTELIGADWASGTVHTTFVSISGSGMGGSKYACSSIGRENP